MSLGLLIDNSGSMRALRGKVEAAALALSRASNPDDEMFVVNFNDKARVDVPLTSDVGVLESGIRRADAIGGTAMRDAIELAQRYLDEHGTRDRKVLLVVTDGIDNASVATRALVERQADRRETVIFAKGLFGDEQRSKRGRAELDELVARTGGLAVPGGRRRHRAGRNQIAHETGVNDYRFMHRQQAPTAVSIDSRYRERSGVVGPHPRRLLATAP